MKRAIGWMVVAAAAIPVLDGCVVLLGGAAVGGAAVVATDRRSVGIQLEDERIESRVAVAMDAISDRLEKMAPESGADQLLLL